MSKIEIATLAGGCFWGMQEIIRNIPGVQSTRVGFIGGQTIDPTYEQVKMGTTGHAESVEVSFLSNEISYREVLHYFFRIHDPTTLNRQGDDIGHQYRSAIFYHNEDQRQTANEVKDVVGLSNKWSSPLVTEITPASTFYPASDYHQDYLQKHPNGYTCHWLRD